MCVCSLRKKHTSQASERARDQSVRRESLVVARASRRTDGRTGGRTGRRRRPVNVQHPCVRCVNTCLRRAECALIKFIFTYLRASARVCDANKPRRRRRRCSRRRRLASWRRFSSPVEKRWPTKARSIRRDRPGDVGIIAVVCERQSAHCVLRVSPPSDV